MTTLTAHVTDDFVTELDSLAEKLDRSRAWLIKEAIKEYLERHRIRAKRWEETLEAIDAAERGEVVSGEEVFAWLDTWGREPERS